MKTKKFSLDFMDDTDVVIADHKIDKDKLDAFAKGAITHSTVLNKNTWKEEDPYADPNFTTTLRLNAYEVGLLKDIARKESRSMNSLIRIVLVRELEKMTFK